VLAPIHVRSPFGSSILFNPVKRSPESLTSRISPTHLLTGKTKPIDRFFFLFILFVTFLTGRFKTRGRSGRVAGCGCRRRPVRVLRFRRMGHFRGTRDKVSAFIPFQYVSNMARQYFYSSDFTYGVDGVTSVALAFSSALRFSFSTFDHLNAIIAES